MRRLYNPQPFWNAVRARLDTPEAEAVTGGPGRVRGGWQKYPEAEAGEGQPWARYVVQPAIMDRTGAGPTLVTPFLVIAEAADLEDLEGWAEQRGTILAGLQMLAHRRLRLWAPTDAELAAAAGIAEADLTVRVVRPVWLDRPPHDTPQYDEDRGLVFTSAEYRVELGPTPEPAP